MRELKTLGLIQILLGGFALLILEVRKAFKMRFF